MLYELMQLAGVVAVAWLFIESVRSIKLIAQIEVDEAERRRNGRK